MQSKVFNLGFGVEGIGREIKAPIFLNANVTSWYQIGSVRLRRDWTKSRLYSM